MWCDVKLLDLILPLRCVVCDAPGEQLCRACRDALPRLAPPLCARCGKPTEWSVARCGECAGRRLAFASARAAVAYDDRVRRFVRGCFDDYAHKQGKPSWVEMSLDNVAAAPTLLALFPRAKIINMVRDPRDVACSRMARNRRRASRVSGW